MSQQRFLQQIAQFFFDNNQYAPSCLIFPNKRSAIYFRDYFKRLSAINPDRVVLRPVTTTIGRFLEQQSELEAIAGINALFEMYESYRQVAMRHNAEPMAFERFVFWGRMLINDFNDIDAALADARALYKNLADLKEISSNFLTEEQLEVLQYVFGRNMVEHYRAGDNGRFWRHIDKDGSNAHGRFVELWQLLGEIYEVYTRRITDRGLGYPGLMARKVADSLADGAFDTNFGYFAFVGFNAPSVAVMRIMQLLQRQGKGLYFWDLLPDNSLINKRAGRRVSRLNAMFAMPDEYIAPAYNLPTVDVRSVPSKTLQTKEASAILHKLQNEKLLNTRHPDKTALILPDPSLLSPMVQSIPNSLGAINITMGLPMRNTFFASVMRNIISLQVNADIRHGDVVFRSQDVRNLVSNPRLLTAANRACCAVIDYLDISHTYMVSAAELIKLPEAQEISMLFNIIDENDSTATYEFLCEVLNLFKSSEQEDNSRNSRQDAIIVETWQKAVDNVFDLLKSYRISTLGRNAYFGLVWRIISTDEFHMSGSPLVGLQVMGMLETRALDFDNVIVLSVNENVCPPRHSHRTFIPAMLRRAFALPTSDEYALEYDYYFLRLLSRSKRVTFIYDSRTSTRRNARSHLIDQLVYLRPEGLSMTITPLSPEVELPAVRDFSVTKTPEVMKRVNKLLEYNSGVSLSASSLKKYRQCPLKFYLTTVCRLHEKDEPEEYMTASQFGTVIHRVLEKIFVGMRTKGSTDPAEVTEGKLLHAANTKRLKDMVLDTIDEVYHYNYYKNRDRATMPGESLLLSDLMVQYISKILEKELDYVRNNGSFKFVAAEEYYGCKYDKDTGVPLGRQLVLANGRKVNFTMEIDRHDILPDGSHHFVDYKTGEDKNNITGIAGLFEEFNSKANNDAALQLLIYAEGYLSNHPDFKGEIVPSVYRIKKAFVKEFADDRLTLDKEKIKWSADAPWRTEFFEKLTEMIESIFDPDVPFRQTRHLENCRNCSLLDFCMRKPKKF